MTITKYDKVPVASASISFFWKMKQLVLIDLNATTTHKVKRTYVIRNNAGAGSNIALWITTEAGVKYLNTGVSDSIPGTYVSAEFDFSDDACGVWLDKPVDDDHTEHIVIGTGDVRNITVDEEENPGEIVKINLRVAETSPVIITCSDDFLLRFHASSIPGPVTVSSGTVANP